MKYAPRRQKGFTFRRFQSIVSRCFAGLMACCHSLDVLLRSLRFAFSGHLLPVLPGAGEEVTINDKRYRVQRLVGHHAEPMARFHGGLSFVCAIVPHVWAVEREGRGGGAVSRLVCTLQLGEGGYSFVYVVKQVPSADDETVLDGTEYALKKV
jgi:hypothetical protein